MPNQIQSSVPSQQLMPQSVASLHGSDRLPYSSQSSLPSMQTHPQYSTIYQQPDTTARLVTNPDLSSIQAPNMLPQVPHDSLPQPGLQQISSQQPFQATSYAFSHIQPFNETQPTSIGSLPQANRLTVHASGTSPQFLSDSLFTVKSDSACMYGVTVTGKSVE